MGWNNSNFLFICADGIRIFEKRKAMSYYTCIDGPAFTDWKKAGWCQIHMELTQKQPYAMHGHYTFWDWLVLWGPHGPQDEDPSYYTVEPFEDCTEGATFDSWYKDNYADAFECQNALTRINGECYETQVIGTNWLGYRQYKVVPSGKPPEPLSFCEFHLTRARVDQILYRALR